MKATSTSTTGKRKRKVSAPPAAQEVLNIDTAPVAEAQPATEAPAPEPEPVEAVAAVPEAANSAPAMEAEPVAQPEPSTPPAAAAPALPATLDTPEAIEDAVVVDRVEHLAKDVAWALITAGVIGIVMPGVLGTPFLIAGAAALWPGNRKHLEKWRQGHTPKFFHGGVRQINRFLDDLERRYPRDGSKR